MGTYNNDHMLKHLQAGHFDVWQAVIGQILFCVSPTKVAEQINNRTLRLPKMYKYPRIRIYDQLNAVYNNNNNIDVKNNITIEYIMGFMLSHVLFSRVEIGRSLTSARRVESWCALERWRENCGQTVKQLTISEPTRTSHDFTIYGMDERVPVCVLCI